MVRGCICFDLQETKDNHYDRANYSESLRPNCVFELCTREGVMGREKWPSLYLQGSWDGCCLPAMDKQNRFLH